jgi:hypothetical protein
MNWRKSSYSGGNGAECVEVAGAGDRVLVRDSKNKDGARLAVGTRAWQAFAAKVKRSLARTSTQRLGPSTVSAAAAPETPWIGYDVHICSCRTWAGRHGSGTV